MQKCSSETRKKCRVRPGRAGQQGAADVGGNEATGQDGWMDGWMGHEGR